LFPGPSKDKETISQKKTSPPLVDRDSTYVGLPFDAPPSETAAKERETKLGAEIDSQPDGTHREKTGGTGMPTWTAKFGSSANEEIDGQSHDSESDAQGAPASEKVEAVEDVELEAKREERIQAVRSRSQSRHTLADTGERERLEALVASFAKSAIQGCPCTYVDSRSGKRTNAIYQINSELTYITIAEQSNGRRSIFKRNGLPLEVSLSSIVDVDVFEDCSMCLDAKAVKKMMPEDQERFLMIFFDSQKTLRTDILCLLLETPGSRDTFKQSLRVLKGVD